MKFENTHNSSMMTAIRIMGIGGVLAAGAIWGASMFCSLMWVVDARAHAPSGKAIACRIRALLPNSLPRRLLTYDL